MISNWSKFIKRTKNLKPRRLLIHGLKYVKKYDYALDFGAGGLRDTRYLLKFPFKEIDVVDSSKVMKELAETLRKRSKLNIYIQDFTDFPAIANRYNIINAQFSLPFIRNTKQKEILNKLISSLANNGVFVGNFFGEKDAWNDEDHPEITFYSKKGAQDILKNLNVVYFKEKKYNKESILDGNIQKWHVIEFIALKK